MAAVLPFLPLPEESTGFMVFLGRFHPLLLHFPIVLVLLTVIFEGLNVYQKLTPSKTSKPINTSFLVGPLLLVSAASTLITVLGGYLLFQSGEYQGELVRQHLWGGVLLLIALNSATFFYWWPGKQGTKKIQAPYQGFIFLAGVLVLITSHLGGSITHGQDFLTEHMPSLKQAVPAPVELKKQEDLLVFEDLILPIVEDKCQSCHNQYKTKGGLILTSFDDLQKGGKSEKPMLVQQKPIESELFHRISLPDDDEDKMPPSEKTPLNEDEVALIQWWIKAGAGQEMLVGPTPPDSMQLVLERFLPRLFESERLKMRQENELESLAEELADFGEEIGLIIEQDPEYTGYFAVSMQIPPTTIDNQTIKRLKDYASIFSKLSLPAADIDDDALFDIGKMKNLRYLYLPKTSVTGDGLIYLKDLSYLEKINLSNSKLSNEGILNLVNLPDIKTVYVWGSATDTLVLQALREYLPEVDILEEEGVYY